MGKIKECKHYWDYGYTGTLIIYCTKCKIELEDLIGHSHKDYKCKRGKLIPLFASTKTYKKFLDSSLDDFYENMMYLE